MIIVGRLGQDPEIRYTQDGSAIANLSIATSEEWKDKNTGEKREATEWHRVVLFRRLAEICGQYLAKGRQVYIEGRLQTRKWQDRDGNDRYTTEIVANSMQMLGGMDDGTSRPKRQQGNTQTKPGYPQKPYQDGQVDDDSIPF